SEPVALSTFTPTDILLTGPGGAVVGVTAISLVGGSISTYRLTVPALTVTGEYTLVVGPNIGDVSGRLMDQDEDGVAGESVEDQYRGVFTIDATGPRVTSVSVSGDITSPVRQVDVIFSEAMAAGSFTAEDVRLVLPGGAILSGLGVSRLNATTFQITFASQSQFGEYTLEIGPDVQDTVGNAMDQNQDGAPGGDADRFRGTWRIVLPDLVPSQLSLPGAAQPGQTVTVTWRTTNRGNAPAIGPWTETIILSLTGNPTGPAAQVVVVGAFQATEPLAVGATVDRSITVAVPITFGGTVTAFVGVDYNPERVVESDENNFTSTTLEVQVGPPPVDLVVSSLASPPSGRSGSPIEVSWLVRNSGALATEQAAWSDRVYLSRDGVLDAGDTVLGTVARDGALDSGGTYAVTRSFGLPQTLTAGSYSIILVVDALSQVTEPGGETNNTLVSTTALVVAEEPTPDLVVESVVAPAAGVLGRTATFTWVTRNAGEAAASGSWNERIYLSTTGTLTGAVLLATVERAGGLAAGAQSSGSHTVILPALADGAYFVLVVTDATDVLFERGGETNNLGTSANAMTLQHVDLAAAGVRVEGLLRAGGSVTVRWDSRNAGTAPATGPWLDQVFLSTDAIRGNDVLLGSLADEGSLAAGGTRERSLAVLLPDGIEGAYWILVVVDGEGAMNPEGGAGAVNNLAASEPLTVQPGLYADLTVTTASTQPRVIGNPADLTISWTIRNAGAATTTTDRWVDRVVLSIDEIYGNADDVALGDFEHTGSLPAGATYSESRIVTLRANLEGRFKLLVRTDALGGVFQKPNTAPDVLVSTQVVEVIRGPYADLVVQGVTAPPTATNNQ
ncbi:MAG: hypothetical protein IT580_05445, partial [Verrucomicrobiales bacterium]|nr:hypothetical protein [Verrucomicrobiales bacterium]